MISDQPQPPHRRPPASPAVRAILWLLGLVLVIWLCTLLFANPAKAAELPIRPGAQGWGAVQFGGSGRNTSPPSARAIKVTNLNDSGEGSLRSCVDTTGPRTCVFEVGGWLPLASNIAIRNPYITIAGATAPSPGVHLRNGELHIFTHDVFIEHLYGRAGDDVSTGGPISSRHCITIAGDTGGAQKVFIGHFSGSWSVATCFNTWYAGNTNITLQDSIIAEPLDDSYFGGYPPYQTHHESTNSLVGYNTKKLSFIRNLLAHGRTRFPLIKSDTSGEMVNNLIFGWGNHDGVPGAIDGPWFTTEISDYHDCPDGWCNQYNGLPSSWDFESNYWRPDPESVSGISGIYNSPSSPSSSGSRYYIHGNVDPLRTTSSQSQDEWLVYTGPNGDQYKSNTPVVRSPELSILPTTQEAFTTVLTVAGARVADSDPIDSRIKNDVVTQTARSINCVTDTAPEGGSRCQAPHNAGGWYELPATHRVLELPVSINTDSDQNGYTDLEDWNFAFEADVEGAPNGCPGGCSGGPTPTPSLTPSPTPTSSPNPVPTGSPSPIPTATATITPSLTPTATPDDSWVYHPQ